MKNELFDMYSRLRCYLYIILLMCISSSSFALTDEQKAFSSFAENTICSHPTVLDYCVPITESDSAKKACMLWLVGLQAGQAGQANPISWTFKNITNNYCFYDGIQANTGNQNSNAQPLVSRTGMCPQLDSPPPKQILFTRKGRWFSQEVTGTRCFERCEYTATSSTFIAKNYVFTNGVLTQFTENMSSRAKSNAKLCFSEPEPARNDDGEITEDASCSDNVFKVFCDFVNWYRTDAEMPDAPDVENKTLDIPTYLKTDHVAVNPNGTSDFMCFTPIEFDLYLPFSQTRVQKSVEFYSMCAKLRDFSFFLQMFYYLHAAFIIFRK